MGQRLGQHLAADVVGAGVAAVRNDAPHCGGQIQAAGQQHGGRAHRNAHQKERGLGAEMFVGPKSPSAAVVALLYAHGDGVSPAGAVAALVGQQDVVPQTLAKGVAAHTVPAGKALVSVEDDGHRRAVGVMIVPRRQQSAVVRGDLYRFIGRRGQGLGVLFQLGAVGQRLGHFLGGGVLGLRRMVEPKPINPVGRSQYRSRCRSRGGRSGRDQMSFFHNKYLVWSQTGAPCLSIAKWNGMCNVARRHGDPWPFGTGLCTIQRPRPPQKKSAPAKNHLHFPAEFGILYKFPVFRERKQNVRS